MSESLPEMPIELLAIPTPDELYEFGLRLELVASTQKKGGIVETSRNELNEDYETVSADIVQKQLEISAKQASIDEIQSEITDIIESMSNDDAMISADDPSADEMIRTRTDILYSRLRNCKQKKALLKSDINSLLQDMDASIIYKDHNRQDEQRLAEREPMLRQELSRLALVMSAVDSLLELKPAAPRYADIYKYTPSKQDNRLDGFVNTNIEPGEQYRTISIPIPITMPVVSSVEELSPSSDIPIKTVLPLVLVSAKVQKKYLQPLNRTTKR
jgi:hypothetical protein